MLMRIRELEIKSPETFQIAAEYGLLAKERLRMIEEQFSPHIKRADEAHKELIQFRRRVTQTFEDVENASKNLLAEAHERSPEYHADGVGFQQTWGAEIVDESKLPREYLMPDLKKIQGIVLALGEEARIPGVRAYKRTRVSYRV